MGKCYLMDWIDWIVVLLCVMGDLMIWIVCVKCFDCYCVVVFCVFLRDLVDGKVWEV